MDSNEYSPAANRLADYFEKYLEKPDPYRTRRRRPKPDDDPSRVVVYHMLEAIHQKKRERFLCRLLGSPDGGRYVWLHCYFSPIMAPVFDRGPGVAPLVKMVGVSGPPAHQDHPIETPLLRHFPTMKIVTDQDGTQREVLAHPVLDADGKPVLNKNGRPKFNPDQRGEAIQIAMWAPLPHGTRESGEPWWGFAVIVHDEPMLAGEVDDITEWAFAEHVLVATCGPTEDRPLSRVPTLEGLQSILAANGWTPNLLDPDAVVKNERDRPEEVSNG